MPDMFRDGLAGSRDGEAALVCANGPSLDLYPKEFYENWNGFTVGINRIKLLFTPDYFVALDVLHGYIEDCKRQEWFKKENQESEDWGVRNGYVENGHGSTGVAISVAYQLGASSIYIIGLDGCPDADGNHYFKERRDIGLKTDALDCTCEKQDKWYDKQQQHIERQLDCYKIPIYNLSPFSRYKTIPHINLRNES